MGRIPVVDGSDTVFEATILPHSSLTRRGWRWLVLGLLGGLLLLAVRFCLIGAWPVAVFAGLEIALFLALLCAHARAMRRTELIMLSPEALVVIRSEPNGRRSERRLEPTWLRVMLQERTGRVPALMLRARGVREEIGRVLGETEKRALAAALETALYRLRNPRFDNAQLREPPSP